MGRFVEFESYLSSVEGLLRDLGVPGVFSSPAAVKQIEGLYDSGAPLDVVLRGLELGAERKIKKGSEVRGLGDLMRTVRSELRRLESRGSL